MPTPSGPAAPQDSSDAPHRPFPSSSSSASSSPPSQPAWQRWLRVVPVDATNAAPPLVGRAGERMGRQEREGRTRDQPYFQRLVRLYESIPMMGVGLRARPDAVVEAVWRGGAVPLDTPGAPGGIFHPRGQLAPKPAGALVAVGRVGTCCGALTGACPTYHPLILVSDSAETLAVEDPEFSAVFVDGVRELAAHLLAAGGQLRLEALVYARDRAVFIEQEDFAYPAYTPGAACDTCFLRQYAQERQQVVSHLYHRLVELQRFEERGVRVVGVVNGQRVDLASQA